MKNVLIEGLYLNPKVKEIKFKSLSTSVDKNKVKVKWVASAVCNSERRRLLGLKNHKNLEEFGAGHEGVGVVNDNKKNLVILLPHNNCITRKYINKSKKFILCNNCETGKINICSKMKHAGLENNEPFSFSSFSYVNQSQLKKISNLQIEKAIFTEPLSCVLRAWKLVSNNSFIVKKKNVLVIGGGPIGSLHALYISKILKNNVYIYEKNRIRRKVLKKIFHDNQKVQILEKLNNVFYDISIMATSEKSGYEYCKKNTKIDGIIILFSGFNNIKYDDNEFFPEIIHRNEFKFYDSKHFFVGSSGYDHEDIMDSISLLKKKLDPRILITGKVIGIKSKILIDQFSGKEIIFKNSVLVRDIKNQLKNQIKVIYFNEQ